MLDSPYSILALPPGKGKTLCAYLVARRLKHKRVLVVCPGYLVQNWKSEIKKYESGNIIDCITTGADICFPVDADFVIISYDLAKKAEVLFKWASCVFLDEGHFLKNVKAKRTELLHEYIYKSNIPRVHILTGTPIKNRVEEFYSLIAICNYNPKIYFSHFIDKFPDSVTFADYFSFRREFEIIKNNRPIRILKWEGLRNEEELKEKWLKGIYFSVKEAKSHFPVIRVKVATKEDIELQFAFNKWTENPDSVMPAAKAKSALLKAQYTSEYCKNLSEQVGPLVVYSDHVASTEEIAKKLGVRAITGATSAKERERIKNEFMSGQTNYIVATIGSFSTGVTLTRACNMVFNDYPWEPGSLTQAKKRIDRIGQTKPCVYHFLLASEQDELILEAIEEKERVIDKLYE